MNIFNKLLEIFKKKPLSELLVENYESKGLLIEDVKESDWVLPLGSIENRSKMIVNYLPEYEGQSNSTMDSMSCATFSALNALEFYFKLNTIPHEHQQFLLDNGYYRNGEINFSDKYSAIMSGTTIQGNYQSNVGNSLRHDGVIPQEMLPFGNSKYFAEWHNRSQITSAMTELGKKFVSYFDISYYWVYFKGENSTLGDEKRLKSALLMQPIQIAIPVPGSHAVTAFSCDDDDIVTYFDHYDKSINTIHISRIHNAVAYTIIPRTNIIKTPYTRLLKIGTRGNDVKNVQELLGDLVADGVFGKNTHNAVVAFQKKNKLVTDGIVGQNTYAKLFPLKNIAMIQRIYEGNQTRGEMIAYNTSGNIFQSKTIERGWKENKSNISCIPKGEYMVHWTYSPAFQKMTYEVRDVEGRSGIRFHASNYASLLNGCIALGKDFADLNKDGLLDVTSSVATVTEFENLFKQEPFTLIIN